MKSKAGAQFTQGMLDGCAPDKVPVNPPRKQVVPRRRGSLFSGTVLRRAQKKRPTVKVAIRGISTVVGSPLGQFPSRPLTESVARGHNYGLGKEPASTGFRVPSTLLASTGVSQGGKMTRMEGVRSPYTRRLSSHHAVEARPSYRKHCLSIFVTF